MSAAGRRIDLVRRWLGVAFRAAVLLAMPVLAGCNAGLIALVAIGVSGGGGSGRGAPVEVAFVRAEGARSRPDAVRVIFNLAQKRSRPGRVVFEYSGDGAAFAPMTVSDPSSGSVAAAGTVEGLDTAPGGLSHAVDWDAAGDLGGDNLRTVSVRCRASNTSSAVVTVGNDAPRLEAAELSASADGVAGVSVLVADTSSDPVEVVVEYSPRTVEPGAFSPATILGGGGPLQSAPAGLRHELEWGAAADLGTIDRTVRVRLTPRDRVEGRPGKIGAPLEAVAFLDNNIPPGVVLLAESAGAASDGERGQLVRLSVEDPDGDPVDVVVQWSVDGAAFPALPVGLDADPAERSSLLGDPTRDAERRALRIATLASRILEGPVEEASPALALEENEVLATWLSHTAEAAGLAGARDVEGDPIAAALLIGRAVGLVRAGAPVETRRICGFEPASGKLRLAAGFSPPAQPGDGLRVELGSSLGLEASADGVVHGIAWRSDADIPGGGAIRLRVTPFDTEAALAGSLVATCTGDGFPADNAAAGSRGAPAESAAGKALGGPFSADPDLVLPLAVVDEPFAAAAGDLDADGGMDLAVACRRSRALVLLLQTVPSGFDPLRLLDSRMGEPTAVAVADFDADGRTDVVVASEEFTTAPDPEQGIPSFQRSGSVLVFLQRRPGDFISGRVYLTAAGSLRRPSSLQVVDLDLDGDLDILAGDSSSSDVGLTVFSAGGPIGGLECGDPEDGFVPCRIPVATSLGGVNALLLADLTADGVPELVAGRSGGVTIFFRSGSGEIGGSITDIVLEGREVRSVALADLTADTLDDLVVAASGPGGAELLVLEQRAPGDFASVAPPEFLAGVAAAAVLGVDLDAAGTTDLVVAHSGAPGSRPSGLDVCFAGRGGDLSCGLVGTGTIGTDVAGAVLAASDVDGDGRLDLISADSEAHRMLIRFQDFDGRFSTAPVLIAGLAGGSAPPDLAAADLDGDRLVDFVVTSLDDDAMTLVAASGAGEFVLSTVPVGAAAAASGPVAIAAGDLDGDGLVDLASANLDSDDVTLFYRGADGGYLVRPRRLSAAALSGPHAVALGDIDGDGRLDVVVAGRFSDNVVLFVQQADHGFAPGAAILDGVGGGAPLGGPLALLVVDVNRDGRSDVVTAGHESRNVVVLVQSPERGEFPPAGRVEVSTSGRPVGLAAADVDRDGDIDLALAQIGSQPLVLLEQRPGLGLVFAARALLGFPAEVTATSVATADLDGDGVGDLVLANASSLRPSFEIGYGKLENGLYGVGRRRSLRSPLLGAPVRGLVVDLDGDGELDIVAANRSSDSLAVFYGGR